MSFPNSLIDLASGISVKQKVIASSLTGNSSRSFSQSTSYVTSQGAGASSSSSAKSPAGNSSHGQQTIFVAGATSSNASASASASIDDAHTSVQVTVPAQTSPQAPSITDKTLEPQELDKPPLSVSNSSPDSPPEFLITVGELSAIDTIHSSPISATQSSSSSSSTSFVTETGAGASSEATATDSLGQTDHSSDTVFTPGANSSESSSTAVATPGGATVSTDVAAPAAPAAVIENRNQPTFQIGSGQNDLIRTTDSQDIITGYAGSDIFDLASGGGNITDIANADIITDFDISEDYLLISDSLTVDDLGFRSIDFNGDTVVDSTVIRLRPDGNILAVVLNTVLPVVNDQEQTTELDADSGDTLNALVEYPIDYLLGTSANDILVSDRDRDILVGYGNADTFVLEPSQGNQLTDAAIIIDFDPEEGDVIQLSSEISFDNDIILETIDLDGNGIVESTSIYLTNGPVLAIAQGTVDLLGNTTLSSHAFISGTGM